jgi:hypothetical protein
MRIQIYIYICIYYQIFKVSTKKTLTSDKHFQQCSRIKKINREKLVTNLYRNNKVSGKETGKNPNHVALKNQIPRNKPK